MFHCRVPGGLSKDRWAVNRLAACSAYYSAWYFRILTLKNLRFFITFAPNYMICYTFGTSEVQMSTWPPHGHFRPQRDPMEGPRAPMEGPREPPWNAVWVRSQGLYVNILICVYTHIYMYTYIYIYIYICLGSG